MTLDDLDEFDGSDDAEYNQASTPPGRRRLTDAQKDFLNDLIEALEIPESGALAITNNGAQTFEDLSVPEASELISALKDARDEQQRERYQGRRRYDRRFR